MKSFATPLLIAAVAIGVSTHQASAQGTTTPAGESFFNIENNVEFGVPGGPSVSFQSNPGGTVAFSSDRDPTDGSIGTSVQYTAAVPDNQFGIPAGPISVEGNGRVRYLADLSISGSSNGVPVFAPTRFNLVGSLDIRDGQPVVDNGLSFDLLDGNEVTVNPAKDGPLAGLPDIIIPTHPVRGTPTGTIINFPLQVRSADGATQTLGLVQTDNADLNPNFGTNKLNLAFSAPCEGCPGDLNGQVINFQGNGTLNVLASLNLNHSIVGNLPLRLVGTPTGASSDTTSAVAASALANGFNLFNGPQAVPGTGLSIRRHRITPEPGTLALLGLGALMFTRRRRAA